jgi:hypothetical protein
MVQASQCCRVQSGSSFNLLDQAGLPKFYYHVNLFAHKALQAMMLSTEYRHSSWRPDCRDRGFGAQIHIHSAKIKGVVRSLCCTDEDRPLHGGEHLLCRGGHQLVLAGKEPQEPL